MRIRIWVFAGAACLNAVMGSAGANVIGDEDGRRPITAAGAELGLSADEAEQIRAATGYVFCSGSKHGNTSIGSGALLVDSQVAVASAHQFVDGEGRMREPFEECFFRNQAVDFQKIAVGRPHGGSLYLGMGSAPPPVYPRDFAVARLEEQVAHAVPFPIYEGSPDDLVGHSAILVTAHAKSLESNIHIPLVQACAVRSYMAAEMYFRHLPPAQAKDAIVLLTDCDAETGASGGILLVRRDGALTAVGTVGSTGKPPNDGESFNYTADSYTAVVMLSGQYRDAVIGVAGKGPIPPDNALAD